MRPGAAEGGRLTAGIVAFAVAAVAALFIAGLVMFFVRGGPAQPFHVRGFLAVIDHAVYGIARAKPRGFIEIGLLVLLFAPFFRLLAGVIRSARQLDWRFVAIGLFVMALLATGIVLGTG